MRKILLRGSGICLLLTLLTLNIGLALSVDEAVKNFRDRYEKTHNFSANFEETTLVAGRKRVASGDLSFQKPNLLKQRYINPSNPENTTKLIVSDGQMLWAYVPLINQVTKTKLAQDEDSMELLPGFGQSLENVDKNYSLRFVEDELAEKRGVYVVELTPKNRVEGSDAMFDIMQIWIRSEDSLPIQFMYKNEKNETTFILSFKNIKINENLGESTFKFEVPKGVQVITVPAR